MLTTIQKLGSNILMLLEVAVLIHWLKVPN